MLINKNTSPCRHCKARREGCHAGCVDYLSWKQQREKQKEHERQERAADNALIESCVRMKKERRR